jgi:cyclopropane-fatty-acyl-phospholipid synthase
MIYKFKSQSEGDVLMLEANGDQMLTILGRQPSNKGIITVEQLPAAIDALEAAVIAHEATESRATEDVAKESEADGDGIPLRARAGPFIELLRRSARAGKDVVWGV